MSIYQNTAQIEASGTQAEIIGVTSQGEHYVLVHYLGGNTESMQRVQFEETVKPDLDPSILEDCVFSQIEALQNQIAALQTGGYCDARR